MISGSKQSGPYPLKRLQTQAELLLRAWGVGAADAAVTAEALADADARGVHSHGLSLLMEIARWRSEGGLRNIGAPCRIVTETPATALIDAGGALGFAVSCEAVECAIVKARAIGLALVTVRNSHTFGAAGYYARIAARRGFFAVVTTSSKIASVVAPGGREAVLGTNPLAWAIPTGLAKEPISFDIATATIAGNAVRMAALMGEQLPEGWVVDADGRPVTDPDCASEIVFGEGRAGGLTPLAGHKGFGLALLAHALAGLLPGAQDPHSGLPASPDGANVGHAFLVINPGAIRSAQDIECDTAAFVSALRNTRPLNSTQPVRLPGDSGAANRARAETQGVALPLGLRTSLVHLAQDAGAPVLL